MKKLRCKKQFGTWYYEKIMPDDYNDLDEPVWELYDENKKYVGTAGYYDELFYYVEYKEWI